MLKTEMWKQETAKDECVLYYKWRKRYCNKRSKT